MLLGQNHVTMVAVWAPLPHHRTALALYDDLALALTKPPEPMATTDVA